mgnify:CR=1 FL=1
MISNEATEFMLPLAYASVLLLSYYGPNAHLIGNIRNSNWHYSEIQNINDTVFWLGVMFLVDSGSTVAKADDGRKAKEPPQARDKRQKADSRPTIATTTTTAMLATPTTMHET